MLRRALLRLLCAVMTLGLLSEFALAANSSDTKTRAAYAEYKVAGLATNTIDNHADNAAASSINLAFLVDTSAGGHVSYTAFEQMMRDNDHGVSHVVPDTHSTTIERDIVDPDTTGIADWLQAIDHTAYLNGYANGAFHPDGNMTRAEVAQMFYNLLLDYNFNITVSFTDVSEDAWYADAVHLLASLGIISGVGDGIFEPNRPITRAEFVAIAMRFAMIPENGVNPFTDVHAGDWFYDLVAGSIQYGWINGYADGTFRPNNTITRAEVATMVNRMLGRTADKFFINSNADSLRRFTDVPSSYWAYYQIMEAANSHDYMIDFGAELWTAAR